MRDSYIAQDHLLLALIKDTTIAAIVKEAGMTEASLKTAIEQIRGNRRVESKVSCHFITFCTSTNCYLERGSGL
jgi:ATP-dependent Clp protease ATP-binding subunit ClpA